MYLILIFLAMIPSLAIGDPVSDRKIIIKEKEVCIDNCLVCDDSADIFVISEGDCIVSSIIGSLQSGNIHFLIGGDLILRSSPSSMAQIFTQRGNIEISARDFRMESCGTPTEILAMSGDCDVFCKNLILRGGKENFGDTFAKITAKIVTVEVAQNCELSGGDGSRSMSEISAFDKLKLIVANDLSIQGGSCPDRSFASLTGWNSADLSIGGNAFLLSGPSDSVQVSSRYGSVTMHMEGKLILTGHPIGGFAKIKACDSLALSCSLGGEFEWAEVFSKHEHLQVIAPMQIERSMRFE